MENIFNNDEKIDVFMQIENDLMELEPNSPDEKIENLINHIPINYLNQKEDLMMICQLFTHYSRNYIHSCKGNAIKLFERIMEPIKTYLQDEQTFFWVISGGLFYLKLWFYEENLISIDKIIQVSRRPNSLPVTEYFLPEIIEKEPEIYEQEIKSMFNKTFSEEYLSEFKKLRCKYFNFLRSSNDYTDPSYKEIETNPLRLAIKTDDIDSFQKILSNSNISINSKISESLIENHFRDSKEISFIEYAIYFNAVKIVKYLVMNDVAITERVIYNSISQRNNDIIHIFESKANDEFGRESFFCSISSWNYDLTEYAQDNYSIEFLENCEGDDKIFNMINNTFASSNFIFLKFVLIPFFRKNPLFVSKTINSILLFSFDDPSCFFLRELMKYGDIDVNYNSLPDDEKFPLLIKAIQRENVKAVEIFLNHPDIDINNPGKGIFTPFQCACALHSDMKIIKMFCNHHGFNIGWKDSKYNANGFHLGIIKGNSYAVEYIIDNFSISIDKNYYNLLIFCLSKNILLISKILLKYFIRKNDEMSNDEMVEDIRKQTSSFHEFSEDLMNVLKDIIQELRSL